MADRNKLRPDRRFGPSSMDLLTPREVLVLKEIDGIRNQITIARAAASRAVEMFGEQIHHASCSKDLDRLAEEGAIELKGKRKFQKVFHLTEGGKRALAITGLRFQLIADLCRKTRPKEEE